VDTRSPAGTLETLLARVLLLSDVLANLFKSHWSNQWLTSNQELEGGKPCSALEYWNSLSWHPWES